MISRTRFSDSAQELDVAEGRARGAAASSPRRRTGSAATAAARRLASRAAGCPAAARPRAAAARPMSSCLIDEQRVDEEAVAARRRHAAGRGVRAGDEAELLEVGHHVADRGGRKIEPGVLRQRARADRLALGDVALDQASSAGFGALVEHGFIVHSAHDAAASPAEPSFRRIALIGKLAQRRRSPHRCASSPHSCESAAAKR